MSCTAGHLANINLPPDLMRRLNPGSANGRPRSIARNLFGQADRDETRRSLEREMRRIREDDRLKWNFDFHEERPLSGRYQWEAVGPSSANGNARDPLPSSPPLPRPQPSPMAEDDDVNDCPPLTSARGGTEHSRISPPTQVIASAATLVLPTREMSLTTTPRRTSSDAARVEPTAARSTRQTTMKDYWPDKKPESGTKRPASTEGSQVTTRRGAASNETPAKKSKRDPQL